MTSRLFGVGGCFSSSFWVGLDPSVFPLSLEKSALAKAPNLPCFTIVDIFISVYSNK
jgi:hypothetical protein